MPSSTKSRRTLLARFAFPAILGAAFFLNGCASEEKTVDLNSNAPQQNTSSIPWNRPATWEGAPAGLGGMMNSGSH